MRELNVQLALQYLGLPGGKVTRLKRLESENLNRLMVGSLDLRKAPTNRRLQCELRRDGKHADLDCHYWVADAKEINNAMTSPPLLCGW